MKFISHCDNWVMRNHEAAYNNGDGIWFDWGMSNVTIENSISYRNRGAGIHYEVGTRGVIRNNIVYENVARGIYLSNASHTTVINNLAYRNGMSGITSIGIQREDFSGGHNVVIGNILMDNGHPDLAHTTPDGRGEPWTTRPELIMPEDAPRNTGNLSDFNIFYRSDGREIPFWKGWHIDEYDNIEAWREATGNDQNSIIAKPLFLDLENYDFRPAPGSPALWMLKQIDPACRYDFDGNLRDRSIRSAGPFEGEAEELERLRTDLPLGRYITFPMTVSLQGSPIRTNRMITGTARSIIYGEEFQGELAYGVTGWTVKGIPFLRAPQIVLDSGCRGATLEIDRQTKRLHFLFGALNASPGRPLARFTIFRDDGQARTVEWVPGEDGSIISLPADSTETMVGHSGRTLAGPAAVERGHPEHSTLFITNWENDNEWLPVSRIAFETLDPEAITFIVGVSGERLEE